MGKIAVTRSGAAGVPAGMTRNDVQPGQLFKMIGRNGRDLKRTYAAIANNGRWYSVIVDADKAGALASTAKGTKKVRVVGSFSYSLKRFNPTDFVEKRRDQVQEGELFIVNGEDNKTMYGNLGRLNDGRWASLNMTNSNYAVTGNGRSSVTVVGSYGLDVNVVG